MRSKAILALTACLLVLAVAVAIYSLSGTAPTVPGESKTPMQTQQPAETASDPAETFEPAMPADRTPEEQQASIRYYGTVTSAAGGAPVAGAKIALRMADDAPTVTAYSDDAGAYEVFAEAHPEALLCQAEGFADSRTEPAANSDSVRLDFQLLRGGVVTGQVTDNQTGGAVEGVDIILVPTTASMRAIARIGDRDIEGAHAATTGEDGRYRIEGANPGDYYLHAQGMPQGYLHDDAAIRTVNVQAGETLENADFTLQKGGVVTGVVKNRSGAAVSGARVQIQPARGFEEITRGGPANMAMDWMRQNAISDSDGHYEIKGLRFGTDYVAIARHDDYANTASEPFALAETRPEAVVDVSLSEGSTVSGTVIYDDGEIAPGMGVQLVNRGMDMLNITGPLNTKASDDGTFRIENVPAGDYMAMAASEAGPSPNMFGPDGPDFQTVRVDGESPVDDVRIVADRSENEGAGVIRGTVVDSNGRPVAEANVAARVAFGMGGTWSATSDADGRFEITKLRGKRFNLNATSEALKGNVKNVEVGGDVTIELLEPASITGFVMSAGGDAVPDAEIQIKRESGEASSEFESMMASVEQMMGSRRGAKRTDVNGFFKFDAVEPGVYTIEAKSPTAGTGVSQSFEVAAGQSKTDVVVRLEPGVTFSGSVSGAGAGALSNAQVSLAKQDDDNAIGNMMAPFMGGAMGGGKTAITDAEGKFTIANVAPGNYTLTATHKDFAKTVRPDVSVQAGRDVTNFQVAMNKGGKATGMYAPGGQPKGGVMVNLIGPSGMYMAMTEADGSFNIDGIPPGSYIATAVDMENMATEGLAGMQQDAQVVDIAEEQETPIDFGPQGGTTVTGAIDNAPGTMTTVSLRRPGGPDPSSLNMGNIQQALEYMRYHVGQANVGPDGTFTVDGVPPGNYIMEVISVNFDPASGDFSQLMDMSNLPRITMEVNVGEEPFSQTIQWPTDTDAAP